jgi:HAD superfamily hydrolase (TIGR01509 family)
MTVQGVILDIDGTLVLSNDAHAQAWVEGFATYGYDVPFEKVRPLIGMGGDHVIPAMVPELNHEEGDGKAVSQKRRELMVNSFAPTLSPTQGARDLILKMQEAGLKLIIATSASSQELSPLLKAAQVDDLLDEATTSSDADASKPAPDIVEAALKKMQMEPNQVVMIADTPYDIESANKAGVGVIAVRSGGFDDHQLKGAIAIYDHPADLLANYDNSPLS